MSKVELVKARTFELDPKKRYVILFGKDSISKEDAQYLTSLLAREGVNAMAAVIPYPENVQVIESSEPEVVVNKYEGHK